MINGLFTFRYDKPDSILENEKIKIKVFKTNYEKFHVIKK